MAQYLPIAIFIVVIAIFSVLMILLSRSKRILNARRPDMVIPQEEFRNALRRLAESDSDDFHKAVSGSPEGIELLQNALGAGPLPPKIIEKVIEKRVEVTVVPEAFHEVAQLDKTLERIHKEYRKFAGWSGREHGAKARELHAQITTLTELREKAFDKASKNQQVA